MDLQYPDAVLASTRKIREVLSLISLTEELQAGSDVPDLWISDPFPTEFGTWGLSPLQHFAEMRCVGRWMIPVTQALHLLKRDYLGGAMAQTIGLRSGPTALASSGVGAGTPSGTPSVEVDKSSRATGVVAVGPFGVPCAQLLLLARGGGADPALVRCPKGTGTVTRRGDAFRLSMNKDEVEVLINGEAAYHLWGQLLIWERLGLLGLALGIVDRAWDIALEALAARLRRGEPLAGEQVAQFQVADNDIDRLGAELLAMDVAVDAEKGRLTPEKLALARYPSSAAAARCAQRALHLAALFSPELEPLAWRLVRRAHQLAVFSIPREHELQLAAAGLKSGLRVE